MVPALVSLVYSFAAIYQGRENAKINFEWVAIIAAINILISVVILHKFHVVLQDFVWQLPRNLMLFIEKLGFVAPSHMNPKAFEI